MTAISMRDVVKWSEIMKSKHVLWIFDSCFSGTLFDQEMRAPTVDAQDDAWLQNRLSRPARRIITSGSEKEEVPDRSTFAELLTEVLGGKRSLDGKKTFTSAELGGFLKQQVIKYRDGKQTPQVGSIVIRQLDEGDVVFRLEPELVQSARQ